MGKKNILDRQYPDKGERKKLGITNVKLGSKEIRELRESKLTVRDFKRRFGIK